MRWDYNSDNYLRTRVHKFSKKSRNHHKILVARRAT